MEKDELKEAIKVLAGKIKVGVNSTDALKYSQDALNLANTILTLKK